MTIRREKVVLDLQDNFTTGMLRAAAATKLFDRELAHASGTTGTAEQRMNAGGREIDRYSGRLRLLVNTALAFGPALVPIAAIGVPAVTSLASALGFAALATGGVVVAFQGVGDALKAVNKAQLEPTEANLEAMRLKMSQISPQARDLVHQLADLTPVLHDIRDAGGDQLFPGVSQGIDNLLELAPQAVSMMRTLGDAAGDIFASGTESLTTDRWTGFFNFLDTEARPVLVKTARTAGDLTHGLAEMWMAFEPANRGALNWISDSADDFDRWATELDRTEGFQHFLQFLDETGPQVADTLGSITGAAIDLVQATGPLGGPALRGIEAIADAVSVIADSPFGPVLLAGASGMAALNLAGRTFTPVVTRARKEVGGLVADLRLMRTVGGAAFVQNTEQATAYAAAVGRVQSRLGRFGKSAAGVGALAFATSGLADSMGIANTATLATAGAMAGPWGAAIGAGIGLILDFKAGQDKTSEATAEFTRTLDQQTGALTRSSASYLAAKLGTDDLAAAAERLGVSQADVVSTVMKGSDAVDEFVNKLTDVPDSLALDPERRADVEALGEAMARYGGSVDDAQGSVKAAAAAERVAAQAYRQSGQAVEDETAAIMANITAMQQARAERLRAVNAEIDWFQSIDDAKKALRDNGKTLNLNTQAGRDNRRALAGMASAWNDLNAKQQNAPGKFAAARKAIADQAVAFGMTREAAEKYVDKLLEIPEKRYTKVVADTKGALTDIEAVRARLAGLDGTTAHTSVVTTVRRFGAQNTYADGGHVRGPGGPRDDRIPAWLSNGEFVVNAGATARHRALLEAINARRYADGGAVGAKASMRMWELAFNPVARTAAPGPVAGSSGYDTGWGGEQQWSRVVQRLAAIETAVKASAVATGRTVSSELKATFQGRG